MDKERDTAMGAKAVQCGQSGSLVKGLGLKSFKKKG